MKITKLVAASLLAMASVPAVAQDAGIVAGATVYDPQGGVVGTLVEVTDTYVVVDTGSHTATLPPESVAMGDNGPIMGTTKAELDATVAKMEAEAAAKLAAALTVGATVHGINGTPVGTVKALGADGNVVIAHEVGDVPLPRDQFTTTDAGLSLVFTAAQLDAALAPRAEMKAAVEAAMVPGAELVTADGAPGGTIREIDADGNAVIDYQTTAFALPPSQLTIDGEGRLSLLLSSTQLNGQLGGS